MVDTQQGLSQMLPLWAEGRVTLKDIKGYTEEELNSIAHVAYVFLMQGKNDEARTLFEGLIAIDPRNDYYYRALGVIFQKQQDFERAITQFSYAIRIRPDSPHAYVNRAEIFIALDQHQEAARDLKDALERMGLREEQLSKKAWALLQMVMTKP